MNRLKELTAFWSEFRGSFQSTGAVLPSSRYLAKAIVQPSTTSPRPARLLEAGPGTGAFTVQLIEQLQPNDALTLVELNPRFVEVLRRRLDEDAGWRAKKGQVTIIHGPVEALPADERFHAIVCGLPFNNFEPALVDAIFRKLLSHLEPGGSFSFFEYFGIRTLKAPFVPAGERQRLDQVATTIGQFLNQYRVGSRHVAFNFPPAVVHHLRTA